MAAGPSRDQVTRALNRAAASLCTSLLDASRVGGCCRTFTTGPESRRVWLQPGTGIKGEVDVTIRIARASNGEAAIVYDLDGYTSASPIDAINAAEKL